MKYLRMFGLMAVAASIAVLAMAGTASAETTGCTATEDPCSPENSLAVGTVLSGELEPGTQAVLTSAGGLVEITCGKLSGSGEITRATTPEGKFTSYEYGECSTTVEVLKTPTITIHADAEHNVQITTSGAEVRVKAGGLTCTFGGEVKEGVTGTAGTKPTIDITANVPLKSGFFCPSTAVDHAKLVITSPTTPLYAASGV
jgi:hypothetical protein